MDRLDAKAKKTPYGEEKSSFPSGERTCAQSQWQNCNELRYELVPLPASSPHLAPATIFYLQKLRNGKTFGSNEEVICDREAYFADFKKMEYRLTKSIKHKVDYDEK